MNLNDIVSFLIAGSILLLAFLLLVNPLKTNKKGNFYFGLCLLFWSTFWLDEAFDSGYLASNTNFIIAKGLIQFLTPIAFYLSIKFYTNPYFNLQKKLGWVLISPITYLILLSYAIHSNNEIVKKLPSALLLLNALFYTVLSYLSIQKHQKNIESIISNKENVDLNWIKNIIYAIVGSTIITLLYSTFINAASLNLYINIYFLAVVYMIAYFSIKQGEIYPEHININEIVDIGDIEEDEQKTKLLINDEDLEILKGRLLHLMEVDKPYLDSELSLIKLAEKLSISPHQLSFAINNGYNENFFQFINKYKVKKAEELLKDPRYDHYTILAIGFESGFNSKTAFNTTFKKITSYTPTEYRKLRSNL